MEVFTFYCLSNNNLLETHQQIDNNTMQIDRFIARFNGVISLFRKFHDDKKFIVSLHSI